MKTKLLILLSLVSLPAFSAVQMDDWILEGRYAHSQDLNGYMTEAQIFISSDSKTAVGFKAYDPNCEGFSAEIINAPIHLVDEQPVRFQSQCIEKAGRLYMAAYKTGADFIIDRFQRRKTVTVKEVGSNINFTYSAMGFTKAYNALTLIAQLSERAL